jgi:hypothetical protein
MTRLIWTLRYFVEGMHPSLTASRFRSSIMRSTSGVLSLSQEHQLEVLGVSFGLIISLEKSKLNIYFNKIFILIFIIIINII